MIDIDEPPTESVSLDQRYDRLRQILRECDSVCIGYSGGVDSVFLAAAAVQTLGRQNVLAVTGRSAAYPMVQRDVALECARTFGIPHLEIETDELADERYTANPSNRCYYCKSELWPKLLGVARERGLRTVLDGSNADDAGDYRPGFAAARENDVRSPLLEAGLTKADVRELSARMGLPTWDQPSAPCLSSRLPYGIAVTPARLRAVERAEEALRALGFRELRVRHHDDCLRIELAPAELGRAFFIAGAIYDRITASDDVRVLIDVEGYRRGALNEALVQIGAAATAEVTSTAVPPHEPAGFHGDIAVVTGADADAARGAAPALRRRGFRYIALDAAAFADRSDSDAAALDARADHPRTAVLSERVSDAGAADTAEVDARSSVTTLYSSGSD
ncbi:MAG TPA: ATP-dependent sacrificial sulfur transferase LarE, partial [Longimicrobiales bacterium]|nr:ATP-dependent sacrificial sulfur transferase LarE [Longimicrobiales bacterium]